MKTNQLMTRKMGDFDVYQRTSDGYFDANALLAQWNKGNKRRQMIDFKNSKSTKEFIFALEKDESQCRNFGNADNQIIIDIKGRQTKDGRTSDKVWMHPLLFIDFAMWLNPSFKVQVLKFVYDEMIKYRNLAGDAYNEMKTAVYPILLSEFKKEGAVNKLRDLAKSLNIIVYGKHENEMRNKIGDELKTRELFELEQNIAQWVKLGLISNYDDLKRTLTKLYYQKYPNVLPL